MVKKCFFSNKFVILKILLITYYIIIYMDCRVIIPFKYLQEKKLEIQTPKEIMSVFMNQKIYINIELGSPKQEIQIPIKFKENLLYILNEASSKGNSISNKIYAQTKSSSFKFISEDMEYDYNSDFNMFQRCSEIFYFLEDNKENKYNNNAELKFWLIFDGKVDLLGGFGLQIYPDKDDIDSKDMPCPLQLLKEKKINDNYLWSIYFSKEGNILDDEGYLLLGDYPHAINYNLGFYDNYEFDKNNFRTLYDLSNQKMMNHEIQMSEIYFYNVEGKKDKTNQNYFNNLKKDDFLKEIVIPDVSVYYVTKFDYNFGGIVIPEYFNTYLEQKVFNSYLKTGKCSTEKITVEKIMTNCQFFYCKNEKSIINNIKDKIPTILFSQDHLKYNFTINVNDIIYKKDDYIYFLLFFSTSQKNKWTLGKPFLKKYPFVFNPGTKNIGFYSSFLLTGIKHKTIIIIASILSVIFIIIGLLIGRKKYKMHKIKKQQAFEMSSNNFVSYYKSQKEFKKIILNEIFTSNYPFSEEDFLSLYILFISYIKLHFDTEVIEHLSELVSKNKNFYLLRKIENSEKILTSLRHNLSKNKNFIKDNINISKLYFFLALSSPDLVDEDLEKLELNEKLVEEKKLIDALNDRKDEEILFNKDHKKYLDDVYGEKSSEIVLNSAKETCIHEVLIGFEDDKQNVVSFKDFIGDILNDDDYENEKKNELKDEEVQEKFEEIEDMLISRKEHLLYNVIVDYLKKEIKILYIRRPNYEKEQKVNLLNKVKNIKNKLEIILKAINKI